MEYAILTVTDGNNVVRAEHISDIENARKTWHHWCELLISDNSFTKGMVKLVDENLDLVESKMEYIEHKSAPVAPVVEEEPVEESEPEEE